MSKIEWTGKTWNPLAGCTPISPGCTHCYAASMARRLAAMGQEKYVDTAERRGKVDVFTGKINLIEDALSIPLQRKKPTTWFVNSMSDLFHEDVPDEFIDKVFATMASCSQHTFQVLTKRPDRMAAYLQRVSDKGPVHQNLYTSGLIDYYSRHGVDLTRPYQIPSSPTPELRFLYDSLNGIDPHTRIEDRTHSIPECHWRPWPLHNVWLGTSCEDQTRADERIPHLLKCPAAVRFLSLEPLLGPINITRIAEEHGLASPGVDALDWVIAGGESGPGARPCSMEWIRSIVSQCKAAGVACFVKQLGSDPFYDRFGPDHEGTAPRFHHPTLKDRKGGDPSEWPEDLRVREFPR